MAQGTNYKIFVVFHPGDYVFAGVFYLSYDQIWMKFSGYIDHGQGTNDYICLVIRQGSYVFFVCLLFVYVQNNPRSYEWIWMKFSGNVDHGTRNKLLNFGSDPLRGYVFAGIYHNMLSGGVRALSAFLVLTCEMKIF